LADIRKAHRPAKDRRIQLLFFFNEKTIVGFDLLFLFSLDFFFLIFLGIKTEEENIHRIYQVYIYNMTSVKEQMEDFSRKAEDVLDRVGQPLKPYIPAMSRFLIVATFLEDSLRIFMQWGDQITFMEQSRHFPKGLSHLFLGLNVIVS
jgi:hypothetical protein